MTYKKALTKHGMLKRMKEKAVEWLRKKDVSDTIISHNVSLFLKLASGMNDSNDNGMFNVDPYDLLRLALYHEDFRSSKMLPDDIRAKIGKLFEEFMHLKHLDMSKKEQWKDYSILSTNVPLAVFRTVDLSHLPEDKRVLINNFLINKHRPDEQIYNLAQSMLYVYTPFADMLGLNSVMNKLRDYSSKVLYPKLHSKVLEELSALNDKIMENERAFSQELSDIVNEAISLHGIRVDPCCRSRIKTPGSITLKLVSREMSPEDIRKLHDIVAFMLVTESVDEAYFIAEMIKEKFGLTDDDVDDYIKNPRGETGYQSIHVDIPYNGIYIEVQIKTRKMLERCEKGDWAHALFKPRKINKDKLLLVSRFSDFLKDASTDDIESMSFAIRSDRMKVKVVRRKSVKEIELPAESRIFDMVCSVVDPTKVISVSSATSGRKFSFFDLVKDGATYEIKTGPKKKISENILRSLLNQCQSIDAKMKVRSLLIRKSRR